MWLLPPNPLSPLLPLLPCLRLYQPWLSLAPAPDVPPSCRVHPRLTHRSWVMHLIWRSMYVRRFAELRTLVCLGGSVALPSGPVTGLGRGHLRLLFCFPFWAFPFPWWGWGLLAPIQIHVPTAGICTPRARHNLFWALSLLTRKREVGGVGHSTNNPSEAGNLGQRCFLKRRMARQLGGGTGAEAPGAVGEGGCTQLMRVSCAARPPAPSSTGGSSLLPLTFLCTCLGPKPGSTSQCGSQQG